MPDDFFNQQQNQRKPRYAAGSDIDSIYTGREVPKGGFKQKKKIGCLPKIILTILVITTILTALPGEPKEGDISGWIEDFYYSEDISSATIETHLINSTNKTLYKIKLTYSIVDSAGNIIARKTVEMPNVLAPGETMDCSEVIETPSMPSGHTEAKVDASYKWRTD